MVSSFKRLGLMSESWRKKVSMKRGSAPKPPSAMKWDVLGSAGRETLHYAVLDSSWPALIIILVGSYLVTAAIFMGIFVGLVKAGVGELYDQNCSGDIALTDAAWRLSITALLTLGYADVLPSTIALHSLVTLEQLLGLLMSAFLISILVTKAAIPVSKVCFSRNAVITTRNGVPHLLFRVGNSRGCFMLCPEVRIHYFKRTDTSEGETTFTGKPLEYHAPPLYAPVGTIAHEINAESPLYGKSLEDIAAEQGHILVCISAVDNHYLQQTYARHLYVASNFLLDRRFADACISRKGRQCFDLERLHSLLPINKPTANGDAHSDASSSPPTEGQPGAANGQGAVGSPGAGPRLEASSSGLSQQSPGRHQGRPIQAEAHSASVFQSVSIRA